MLLATRTLIPGSLHYEYDFPQGIGAFPSEIMQTAPMSWGGIVFIMNTTPDELLRLRLPRPPPPVLGLGFNVSELLRFPHEFEQVCEDDSLEALP